MEHLVQPQEDGRSLRDLLRHALLLSEGEIRRAKWSGRLLVNGRQATVRTPLRTGDLITVTEADAAPVYLPAPLDVPLTVPWRDDCLMVIDKPAGMASQSGAKYPADSLENAVFSLLGCPADFVWRPVNRLDKGTSGLMAAALDAHTHQRMQRMLHGPSFERVYLAVTDGVPEEASGTISLPIAKAEGATVRRIVSPEGKPSVTHYEVVRTHAGRALLRLRLETGRTHQIRVHLSAIGCPVFGDFLYGRESPLLPGRFALHSAALRFLHPATGETVSLQSPLPDEMEALLR